MVNKKSRKYLQSNKKKNSKKKIFRLIGGVNNLDENKDLLYKLKSEKEQLENKIKSLEKEEHTFQKEIIDDTSVVVNRSTTEDKDDKPEVVKENPIKDEDDGPKAISDEASEDADEGPKAIRGEASEDPDEGLKAISGEASEDVDEGPKDISGEASEDADEGPKAIEDADEGPKAIEDADEGPKAIEDADADEGPKAIEDADADEGPKAIEDADADEGPKAIEDADADEGPKASDENTSKNIINLSNEVKGDDDILNESDLNDDFEKSKRYYLLNDIGIKGFINNKNELMIMDIVIKTANKQLDKYFLNKNIKVGEELEWKYEWNEEVSFIFYNENLIFLYDQNDNIDYKFTSIEGSIFDDIFKFGSMGDKDLKFIMLNNLDLNKVKTDLEIKDIIEKNQKLNETMEQQDIIEITKSINKPIELKIGDKVVCPGRNNFVGHIKEIKEEKKEMKNQDNQQKEINIIVEGLGEINCNQNELIKI